MKVFLNYFTLQYQFSDQVCQNTNGVQRIPSFTSPCLCGEQPCQGNLTCNLKFGGCTHLQTSIFDVIQYEGQFTFKSVLINDQQTETIRMFDSQFNTVDKVGPAIKTIIDNRNGQYWIKFKVYENDAIIQLRNWGSNEFVKSGYFKDIGDNELRPGNHPLEVICIKLINKMLFANDSKKTIQQNGISIIDFTKEFPTETIIDTFEDLDIYQDPLYHSEKKQMEANSAGVDLNGNQQINSSIGSFLIFQDNEEKKKLYTISSEFRTDFKFKNPGDEFYGQHDVYQLPNGNWMVFDNGNRRPTLQGGQYSRCIEYRVLENTQSIEMVWEYKLDKFCQSNGSCRMMDNGHVLISANNCLNLNVGINELSNYDLQQNQIIEIKRNGNMFGLATLGWSIDNQVYRVIPMAVIFSIADDKSSTFYQLLALIISLLLIILFIQQIQKYIKNKSRKEIKSKINDDQVDLNDEFDNEEN